MSAVPSGDLFPVEAIPRPHPVPAPPPAAALRCTWHRGEHPPATHRLIVAPNLLHPYWQQPGTNPASPYMVGATICGACAARGSGLWGHEMVQHGVPLGQAPQP